MDQRWSNMMHLNFENYPPNRGLEHYVHLGVEPKIGGKPPKWMVKIMENPKIKWMIWGYHYFWKHHFKMPCFEVFFLIFWESTQFPQTNHRTPPMSRHTKRVVSSISRPKAPLTKDKARNIYIIYIRIYIYIYLLVICGGECKYSQFHSNGDSVYWPIHEFGENSKVIIHGSVHIPFWAIYCKSLTWMFRGFFWGPSLTIHYLLRWPRIGIWKPSLIQRPKIEACLLLFRSLGFRFLCCFSDSVWWYPEWFSICWYYCWWLKSGELTSWGW